MVEVINEKKRLKDINFEVRDKRFDHTIFSKIKLRYESGIDQYVMKHYESGFLSITEVGFLTIRELEEIIKQIKSVNKRLNVPEKERNEWELKN